MRVEWMETERLVPYERNAKRHPQEQVDKIARSISEFGWDQPVVVDERHEIIKGHGRYFAAEQLGVRAPVLVRDDLTEEQKRAARLADNRTAESDWDWDLVSQELADLRELDVDLELTGFNRDEIEGLLADCTPEGLIDEDEVPEEPEHPVTREGDVWILGKHRVRCGDSTSADDVAALLNGVEPHLMVTDPPYGVNYDADWRNKAKRPDGTPYGASAIGKVQNDDNVNWSEAWSLFPGDVPYVWHAGSMAADVADSLRENGFQMRSQIIWAKNSLVISRGHYHVQHEPCWYAVRKGRKGYWRGGRKQSTVWEIPKPRKSETGHSTQKPVECMRRPMANNSAPGDSVYDPFLGSGSALIAAEMIGRSCYGMELDPIYCDVIVDRWQQFTGKQAVLQSTGQPFGEVKDGRQSS